MYVLLFVIVCVSVTVVFGWEGWWNNCVISETKSYLLCIEVEFGFSTEFLVPVTVEGQYKKPIRGWCFTI